MIHKLWVDGAMELASFQRLIPEYKGYVVDEKDTVSLGIGSVSRCRVVSVTWLVPVFPGTEVATSAPNDIVSVSMDYYLLIV